MKAKLAKFIKLSLASGLIFSSASVLVQTTNTSNTASAATAISYFKTKDRVTNIYLKKNTKSYTNLALNQNKQVEKKNSLLVVKALTKTAKKKIPVFLLSNGRYVRANKANLGKVTPKIASYLYSATGKMQLTKNTYLYNATSFNSANRVNKLKSGTQITIKSIAWSSTGYPRLKVTGGYVTSNKSAVGAVPVPVTTSTNTFKLTTLKSPHQSLQVSGLAFPRTNTPPAMRSLMVWLSTKQPTQLQQLLVKFHT